MGCIESSNKVHADKGDPPPIQHRSTDGSPRGPVPGDVDAQGYPPPIHPGIYESHPGPVPGDVYQQDRYYGYRGSAEYQGFSKLPGEMQQDVYLQSRGSLGTPAFTDDQFAGPLKDRRCTDVLFLVIFVAFIAFLCYLVVDVAYKGDPRRLLLGYDAYGNLCGVNNTPIPKINGSGVDMTDKPYRIFPYSSVIRYRSCVAECPNETHTPTLIYFCLPINKIRIQSLAESLNFTRNILEEVATDISHHWLSLLKMFLIALAFSLLLLLLLRFFAGVIIWVTILGVCVGGLMGTTYLWYLWRNQTLKVERMSASTLAYDDEVAQANYLLAGGIVASIVMVSALFKEAGKVVTDIPLLLLQPLWTFIILCAFCAGWIVGFLFLYTTQEVDDNSMGHIVYRRSGYYSGMIFYYIFALFWLVQFIISCQHVVIAGATSKWFFSRDKSNVSITESMYWLVRYHLGSVALGALIVAIVQMIRYIMRKFQKLTQRYNESLGFLIKACACCLWCLEKCLKYLNKNAFIEIAIYGYGFCEAARQAFFLLSKNALRVAAINSIGDFLLFLGKVLVTAATGFCSYELLKKEPAVHFPFVFVFIACTFAFAVSHAVMSVYEMIIDTLFLCFCEDCERNNGEDKPYFMSKNLMVHKIWRNFGNVIQLVGTENTRKLMVPMEQTFVGVLKVIPDHDNGGFFPEAMNSYPFHLSDSDGTTI